MVLAGEITLPAGDVREPFVNAADIADVAVAALTEDGHAGQVYELTGPRLLTFAEAVDEIVRATGRTIRHVQIPPETFAAGVAETGLPEDIAWLLDYLFATVLDGRNVHLGDGVRRALGREPGTSPRMRAGPPLRACGTYRHDFERRLGNGPAHTGRRDDGPARCRPGGQDLLRVLELRDEGPGARALRGGHRRDAVDQRRRAQPLVSGCVHRNGRGVARRGWAPLAGWGRPSAPFFLGGALFYLVGTFLVTALWNVPLNDQLAAVSATDPAARDVWEAM